MSKKIGVGDSAPLFSLPDQHGKIISLSDFIGKKPIVLFFYPKDDSAGCTIEACAFRDSYTAFQEAGAEVIGISANTEKSHEAFANKHRLPYILLSDTNRIVRKAFGVPTTFGILDGRVTYVIDQDGVVQHVFNSQANLLSHISEALAVVKKLTV